jgi:hypothetical protein
VLELAVAVLFTYVVCAENSGVKCTSAQFKITPRLPCNMVLDTHYVYIPKAELEYDTEVL